MDADERLDGRSESHSQLGCQLWITDPHHPTAFLQTAREQFNQTRHLKAHCLQPTAASTRRKIAVGHITYTHTNLHMAMYSGRETKRRCEGKTRQSWCMYVCKVNVVCTGKKGQKVEWRGSRDCREVEQRMNARTVPSRFDKRTTRQESFLAGKITFNDLKILPEIKEETALAQCLQAAPKKKRPCPAANTENKLNLQRLITRDTMFCIPI
ncbi:hypothetical protein CBL_08128 [Carabus blaptoides fortunei]